MHTLTLEELRSDYNWGEALAFGPFTPGEVGEVIAAEEGQNDGDSWDLVARLTNGKFGFVTAWCDYTGWG